MKPDPSTVPPADLSKVIEESKAKLLAEEPLDLSRRRGPGRPPKARSEGDQAAQDPELLPPAPGNELEVKQISELVQQGCLGCAKISGWDGFKAEPKEADHLAGALEPLMRRYLPQLSGATVEWALALSAVGMFAGSRYLGYNRWLAEQQSSSRPAAAPLPPQTPDVVVAKVEPPAPVQLAQAPGPGPAESSAERNPVVSKF